MPESMAMTTKNKAKEAVLSLDNYWEYAEIIGLLRDDDMAINAAQRIKLRRLCEQGFSVIIYMCWLVDEFDRYDLYRYTPHAVNLLLAYATDAVTRLSPAQLQATRTDRRKINNYACRNSIIKPDKHKMNAQAQALEALRQYPNLITSHRK
jgi:hypothetical protein